MTLRRRSIIYILVLSMLQFLTSCCSDEISSPPQELYDANDYIFVGKLVAIDTLLPLGEIEYFHDTDFYYVVSYTFEPIDILKGEPMEFVSFWCCNWLNRRDSTLGGPVFSPIGAEFVYGREIEDENDIIKVMRPMLSPWVPDDSITQTIQGQRFGREVIKRAKVILEQLSESPILVDHYQNWREDATIIYGTEYGMATANEFQLYKKIFYCDHGALFGYDIAGSMSFDKYLAELKNIASDNPND